MCENLLVMLCYGALNCADCHGNYVFVLYIKQNASTSVNTQVCSSKVNVTVTYLKVKHLDLLVLYVR